MAEPTEETIRQWAREQMKDSRFMHLCADELRLLICYVRDAVLEEHKAQPREQAKEIVYASAHADYIVCACGRVRTYTRAGIDDGISEYGYCGYKGCAIEVCCSGCEKSKNCWVCEQLFCHEHMNECTSCVRCAATLCAECAEEQWCNCGSLRGCRLCLDWHYMRGLVCGDRCGV